MTVYFKCIRCGRTSNAKPDSENIMTLRRLAKKLCVTCYITNCKDPIDIALRIIKQDDRILRALNNGDGM